MGPFLRYFIFLSLSPLVIFAAGISYDVEFHGVHNPTALKTIKSVSQLVTLKKHSPVSVNALRYRAESDVPNILKALHAYGYYEATVDLRFHEYAGEMRVAVHIYPGPIYKIEEYAIRLFEKSPELPALFTQENREEETSLCPRVELETIGIVLGKPALAKKILDAELKLMEVLAECGYPLAHIERRTILVDGETKGVRTHIDIITGPLSHFGPVTIQGLRETKARFIKQKIAWKEGQIYDARSVEETQKNLIDSGLFRSALVTHEEEVDEEALLPMKIEVTESKHKSISVGASYQTVFGPGITFGWENRNLGGMGRKLSLQGDITKISHAGTATLLVPNFRRVGQDFVSQAVAMRESITAYVQRSYNVVSRVERKIGERIRISGGARVERLFVTESVANGEFSLLEVPLYCRWSTANDLLNPTTGATLQYRAIPAVHLNQGADPYFIQELSCSHYYPFDQNHAVTFAEQVTLGIILSNHLGAVPIPKRFLGGSEEDLRGYRYKTVSPLIGDKPEGGRSAIYYTAELRFRVSQTIGLVPFFDLGNVYTTQLPKCTGRWFKSVGLGVRYFSFIGPLRLDIGFPLDRRKKLDSVYRLLVSIGQIF
jgi:translocation and assembly module TamA